MTFGDLIAQIEGLQRDVEALKKEVRLLKRRPAMRKGVAPTQEEVAEYAADIKDRLGPRYFLAPLFVEKFMLFYGKKNWMVGKTPMADWKKAFCAAVLEWEPPKIAGAVNGTPRKGGAYKVFKEDGLGYQ